MRRHCNGTDLHLWMFVDSVGNKVDETKRDQSHEEPIPCNCGLVFDDAQRSTIYPHLKI